jgi:two-component system, NarL family, nitrate/nitrite response regulator NarL
MTEMPARPAERTPRTDDAPHAPGVSPNRPAPSDGATPLPLGSSRASATSDVERALEPSPRVVIADHNPAWRFGIRLALERAGFLVVADADTGEDAAAVAVAFSPDVCLIDVHIPGGGIAAARDIRARAPGTAVVMLSPAPNEDDLLAAIIAGATGYLLKTMDPERLPVAVRGVLAGEAAIPRALARRVLEEIRRRGNTAAPPHVRGRPIPLTPRESQVVQLLRDRMSTREIAARLGISEVTVRRHVSAALRKLEAPDRQAAVRLLDRAQATTGRWAAR